MISKSIDCEKATEPYHGNENDEMHELSYLPQNVGRGQRKPRWSINKLVIGLVIGILLVGHVLDITLPSLWHGKGSYDRKLPSNEAFKNLHEGSSARPNLDNNPSPASKSSESSWLASIEESPIPLPVDADTSVADGIPGVSLAASVDPAGNRQLYDLTSTGVIRLRKSKAGTDSWSEAEIVPTNPRPKPNSPLAAISRISTDGASNVRLYYLDPSNRVVEMACNNCGPTAPCVWLRQTYFTATSAGGLSVVDMGSYDGIRVFTTNSNGQVIILQWFQNSWRYYYTGLTVTPSSPITSYGVSNSSGATDAIYALAVDTGGALKELVWNRYTNYEKFLVGRTIDASFNTSQPNASISSAYGMPDTLMRVYHLASGVMERYAYIDSTAWDPSWVQMHGSEQPDVPGGAVASISWGNTEVRVYYMAGGSIRELMLTEGIGWRGGGRIR